MDNRNQSKGPAALNRAGEPDLFRRCRAIPAADAAQWLGMAVSPGRGRRWALCPLHGDSRPSLMFDTAGRWHCFGCGWGGDAVDLWAAVRRVRPEEAARQLLCRGAVEGLMGSPHRAPYPAPPNPRGRGTLLFGRPMYAPYDGREGDRV